MGIMLASQVTVFAFKVARNDPNNEMLDDRESSYAVSCHSQGIFGFSATRFAHLIRFNSDGFSLSRHSSSLGKKTVTSKYFCGDRN
jgi:hypothetical protein